MGIDLWVDRGHFPLLFEVEGTPVFCPPYFFGGRHFCTNAHGIHWMIGAIFVKFSQLILMKIIQIVATRCQILRLNASNSTSAEALPQTCWKSLPGFKGPTSKGRTGERRGRRDPVYFFLWIYKICIACHH